MSPAPRAVEATSLREPQLRLVAQLTQEPRISPCCSGSHAGKEHTREVTAMYQEACWLASIFGRICFHQKYTQLVRLLPSGRKVIALRSELQRVAELMQACEVHLQGRFQIGGSNIS